MDNLAKAKDVIGALYEHGNCGLYNTRNFAGDEMTRVYNENGLVIDICLFWSYFEVFGLSPEEFRELHDYYNTLKHGKVAGCGEGAN